MEFYARFADADKNVVLFIGAIQKIFHETDKIFYDILLDIIDDFLPFEAGVLDLLKSEDYKLANDSDDQELDIKRSAEQFEAFSELFEQVRSKNKELESLIFKRLVDGWCSADQSVRLAATQLLPVLMSKDGLSYLIQELDRSNSIIDYSDRIQLEGMLSGQFEEADFLRDISVVTAARGDVEMACALIGRARKLRPQGPVIRQLDIELNKQLLRS